MFNNLAVENFIVILFLEYVEILEWRIKIEIKLLCAENLNLQVNKVLSETFSNDLERLDPTFGSFAIVIVKLNEFFVLNFVVVNFASDEEANCREHKAIKFSEREFLLIQVEDSEGSATHMR